MPTEIIEFIPLEDIAPHPANRSIQGFDQAELKKMADSMRSVGILVPAIVRPTDTDGKFELVAGERRWRAAKIAGLLQLPCVIREMSDLQLLKTQTIENLQRKGVHPLDEADGYARLMKEAEFDVEQLATETGQSVSYIYQRLKLRDLIKPARKILIDGTISTSHGILIARLAPAQQKLAIDYCLDRGEGPPPVRELGNWIQGTIMMELAKAAFKKNDALLFPEGGACTMCDKRTGFTPELFPEVGKKDYCTDPDCFNGKLDAMVRRRRRELKGSGEAFLQVCTAYSAEPLPEGAVRQWDWTECRKKDEGAVRALVIVGTDRGRLTWGRKRPSLALHKPTPEAKVERKKELQEERIRVQIRTQLWKDTAGELEGEIKESGLSDDHLYLITTTLFQELWYEHRKKLCQLEGLEAPQRKKSDFGGSAGWDKVGAKHIEGLHGPDLGLFLIKCALVKSLDWQSNYGGPDHLGKIASSFGIEIKSIEKATRKEFADKAQKKKPSAGAKKGTA